MKKSIHLNAFLINIIAAWKSEPCKGRASCFPVELPYNNIKFVRQEKIMETTKLTVRVLRDRLETLKRYAADHNTSLTDLINAYLEQVTAQQMVSRMPIVARLSGVLSADLSVEDYRKHLEEKYAR
jgi:hypothetical protein